MVSKDIGPQPQSFDRREIKLGLSDGIYVEVLSGLDATSRVKKQETGSDGAEKKWGGKK